MRRPRNSAQSKVELVDEKQLVPEVILIEANEFKKKLLRLSNWLDCSE
jgi:hypothetical protein